MENIGNDQASAPGLSGVTGNSFLDVGKILCRCAVRLNGNCVSQRLRVCLEPRPELGCFENREFIPGKRMMASFEIPLNGIFEFRTAFGPFRGSFSQQLHHNTVLRFTSNFRIEWAGFWAESSLTPPSRA